MESTKKDLFKMAMKGEWDNVVEIYRTNPMAHTAKLTMSGDTALQIAVSDSKEGIVQELVECISTHRKGKEVLEIGNEQGNTPLHIAASIGSVAMCQCIAEVDKSLVGARNHDKETPFFLAVLYGKKEAFLCLHQLCGTKNGYAYSRRMDGDTILHCAISGDCFDLALTIIHGYDKLVNSFNGQGWTPLHLLVGKPSAFRSGSHLGRCYKMIYHCIPVDELKEPSNDPPTGPNNNLNHQRRKYPKNYRTCINFWKLMYWNVVLLINFVQRSWNVVTGALKKMVRTDALNFDERSKVINTADNNSGAPTDVENPKGSNMKPAGGRNHGSDATNGAQGHKLFPANYGTRFEFVKFASKTMLVILGLGSTVIRTIEEKKQKHTWAAQIMNELLLYTSTYEYDDTAGTRPMAVTATPTDSGPTKPYAFSDGGIVNFAGEGSMLDPEALTTDTVGSKPEEKNRVTGGTDNTNGVGVGQKKKVRRESPILVAAKYGVTEMVEKILEHFPIAQYDVDEEKKNMVLLAVEHRQQHLFEFLLSLKQTNIIKDSVFYQLDCYGNSALHLAANIVNFQWPVPGASSQMQWEIKWFEYIKSFMPKNILLLQNKEGKTPDDIFKESHKKLVDDGGQWLSRTSEACTVVAGLFVTATYTTSTTVPGGVKQESGTPYLEHKMSFQIFAVSSFLSFYSSLIAVVMFLAIFTSGCRERDFRYTLPLKLLMGLTAFYVSIASTLISFSTGHFFILKDQLKSVAFPLYIGVCLLVTFFSMAVFPLYFHLAWATFKKVPQRNYEVTPF